MTDEEYKDLMERVKSIDKRVKKIPTDNMSLMVLIMFIFFVARGCHFK